MCVYEISNIHDLAKIDLYFEKGFYMFHPSIFNKDFGDGGAFPEIHVAQYPMGMGMKKSTSNALAVQVDAQGKIKYDVIARHGHAKDKVSNQKQAHCCFYQGSITCFLMIRQFRSIFPLLS